ncbi:hypothetical protein CMK16_06430 [Candidatus Poribacteria bacterium]|nr:hypothetical protein [Candidatus Poribacteria bacterium]|tara:strand:- start:503 stop:793 length:291 start_codon:yes stop_codon:yes gene_type:complete
MEKYEVIVVGIGAVGLAVCYHLAKRGVRVLGIEKFDIPNAKGSLHGFSRQTKISEFIDLPHFRRHPNFSRIILGSAFSGAGFNFSSVYGEIHRSNC